MKILLLLIVLVSVSISAQPPIVKMVNGIWSVEISEKRNFSEKAGPLNIKIVVDRDSLYLYEEDKIGNYPADGSGAAVSLDSLVTGPKGFTIKSTLADTASGYEPGKEDVYVKVRREWTFSNVTKRSWSLMIGEYYYNDKGNMSGYNGERYAMVGPSGTQYLRAKKPR